MAYMSQEGQQCTNILQDLQKNSHLHRQHNFRMLQTHFHILSFLPRFYLIPLSKAKAFFFIKETQVSPLSKSAFEIFCTEFS